MTRSPTILEAHDVMVAEPICVQPSTTIREFARVLEEHKISGVPVVNREGTLVGVVSKTDLIRRCSDAAGDIPPAYLVEVLFEPGDGGEDSGAPPGALLCVDDFMTNDPVTVSRHTPITDIAHVMFDRRIHRVIVVDSANVPVGIITSLDLLGVFSPAFIDRSNRSAKVSDTCRTERITP